MVELDKSITLFLNGIHSPFWDDFFFVFSGQLIWIPFYLTIIYVMWKTYGKKMYLPLLCMIIVVVLSDQISSSILKPLFARLRPSHDSEIQNIVHIVHGYRGGLYGFVSSHAANSFGLAVISSLLFKNKWYSFLVIIWAFFISYSRVYLGVHFLGDVLVGILIGSCCASLVYWTASLINNRKLMISFTPISNKLAILLWEVILLTLIVLLSFSNFLLCLA